MLLNGQGLEVSPASGTPEAAAGASSGLDDPILIFHMASDQTTARRFSFFLLFFMKRDELLKIFEQKFPFLERERHKCNLYLCLLPGCSLPPRAFLQTPRHPLLLTEPYP